MFECVGWKKQCCGSRTFQYGSGSADTVHPTDLRIHIRIRMQIRTRIRTLLFRQWLTRSQKKILFFQSFLAYYFLRTHLHHSSKIKSKKEVTKQGKSRFSLLLLLIDERIREAQKHTNPSDRDSQHWEKGKEICQLGRERRKRKN